MKMTGQKIKEILGPFAVYYVVYHAAFILLLLVLQSAAKLAGREWTAWTAPEQTAATGILGGISMVLGILPLLKALQKELSDRGETFIRTKDVVPQQTVDRKNSVRNGLVTVLTAVTASLGWNIVFSLSGLVQQSESYQDVARNQYGVPMLAGVVLYGIVSPFAEEIVFRGIIFNRLRKDFPVGGAVLLSGILFGLYHGNLVQGVYGMLMGSLMAYLYARMGRFWVPCLFHMAANLTVYLTAQAPGIHEKVFTMPVAAVMLCILAVALVLTERRYF